jgi:hypothetical protein
VLHEADEFSPLGPFFALQTNSTVRSLASVKRATRFTADGDNPNSTFSAAAMA